MTQAALKIDGMHCDACVRRVRTALSKIEGVASTEVMIGSAEVQYDPGKIDAAKLLAAVEKIGYTASVQ